MSQNKYKSIQDLVDNYIASGLSAKEYVEARVDAGDLAPELLLSVRVGNLRRQACRGLQGALKGESKAEG